VNSPVSFRRESAAVKKALRVLALGCVVSLPALSPAAHAQERRCRDLANDGNAGTTCLCSEPLNYAQATASGVINPPDSPSPYQCAEDKYDGRVIDASMRVRSVSGSSVGLPGATYVQEWDKSYGRVDYHGDDEVITNSTYCSRSYFKFSSGHRLPYNFQPPGNVFKGPRWMGQTDSVDLHCSWLGPPRSSAYDGEMGCVGNGASGNVWEDDGTGMQINTVVSGQRVDLDDCMASWCRLEICVDHNSRSGADANKLHYRMRVVRVDNGKQVVLQRNGGPLSRYAHAAARSGNQSKLWMIEDNTNNFAGSREWVSHIMTAKKTPADESFWIGPATEVEAGPAGGGGGGSTDPEPTAPPRAPVLLN